MNGFSRTMAGQSLCLGGAALGLAGLLGWIAGATYLTTIGPDHPAMMPNTALALSLLGVAGALRHRRGARHPRLLQYTSLLATLVVLAIGAGTLAEYLFSIDLHIDSLLVSCQAGPYPGRPSPPTALSLTLLAAALLLFDHRPTARARPSEWFALLAGLIALTALVGSVFGAGPLYWSEYSPVIGVAPTTAASLLLTTLGLLLGRPTAGLMRTATSKGAGGIMLRRMALPTILVPVLLGLTVTRISAAVGIVDLSIEIAVLIVAMGAVGLSLLAITAVHLNHIHDALEANRARTRDLIEQAPDGIFVADPEGRYTDVNGAGCRMLGYPREELIGRTVFDLIPPEDAERFRRWQHQLLEGNAEIAEWRLTRRDGSYASVEIGARILPDGRWQAFVRDITERRRLEDELRLSEAKYSGIVSISTDAILSIDDEQRICMFNEGAAKTFGYAKEEIIGAPLDTLIPERFRAFHRRHVERFAAGSEAARRASTRDSRLVGLRKNGEEFPVDAAISRLDVGGKRILTVTLRDITEEMRVQNQIRQSQERFDLALKGADLAAWDWNVQTGEVVFNPRWIEMRGFSPDELRPHVDSWLSGVHPDDMPRVQKVLKDHFEGLTPDYETEHRVRTKSGKWIWVLDRGRVFARDGQGRAARMVGTELDITERKRLETAQTLLAEVGAVFASTLEYEDTLSNIARLVVRDLADFCIVDVAEDDEVRRVKVVSRDPAKAWLCDSLERLPLERRRPHLVRSALETQRPVLMERLSPEMVESFAQGAEHLRLLRCMDPRSVMAVPLLAHGRLLGAIAVVSSTPDRAYGSSDLRAAEDLARRAALAIENARLYRAAGRAVQARDDVLGIVAHDLRNPLGTILLQAALLRRFSPQADGRARKAAERIERAATRMNRLIQDLLDVTRMEAGRLSIAQGAEPAGQLVADAVEAQGPLAGSVPLELRLDVHPDVHEVWADRDRLLQVFENLIGNAIKFTTSGGSVTVGAASQGSDVLFWVADTGAGIGEEDLPHVFDRFWQARKGGRRGAGLGLPIVKGIVEAHGGRIWVESGSGRGSTFFFTIPMGARAPFHPVSEAQPHRGPDPVARDPPEAPREAAGEAQRGACLVETG